MTVKELIERLSAFDGDMNVVFTTFEPMPAEWTTIAHPIGEIEAKDSVDYAAWEIKKCPSVCRNKPTRGRGVKLLFFG